MGYSQVSEVGRCSTEKTFRVVPYLHLCVRACVRACVRGARVLARMRVCSLVVRGEFSSNLMPALGLFPVSPGDRPPPLNVE